MNMKIKLLLLLLLLSLLLSIFINIIIIIIIIIFIGCKKINKYSVVISIINSYINKKYFNE